MEPEKKPEYGVANETDSDSGAVHQVSGLHRALSNRQIQFIAIGGSIGTALFVTIAWGLVEGGPGSLFIGFIIYSCMMALVNSTMAEMAVAFPGKSWTRIPTPAWCPDSLQYLAVLYGKRLIG